jgi:LEA14-like dessication related protein
MRSLLAGIVVALAGCSMFMHSIEKPKATVRDMSVEQAGLMGVTGRLAVDVMNPNSFGVPLSGIDWQLSIGGQRAATGTVQLSQEIPARGVAPITTSLTIDARDAIAVAQAIAGGAREYTLVATLHFSTPAGTIDVDIDHQGQI